MTMFKKFLNSLQFNTKRTNYIKKNIDNTLENSNCELQGDIKKATYHMSDCKKPAEKEYKSGSILHEIIL